MMGRFILSAFADEIAPDLKTQMNVLEKHDIHYIEMRNVNGQSLVKYSLDEVRTIKKQLDARGFKISAIGSPIGKIKISEDFQPHLDLFRKVMAIAEILETRYIRMFSFFIPVGEDPQKYRDEVMRRWFEFIKAVERSGLILLHENEKGIYGDIPQRCLDLLQTMNSEHLRVIFDPANFIQCDVQTYPEAFLLLKDYLVYLHIKDALYSNHQVVPAGYGDGKVAEILTDLSRADFDGFLSLEPHLASFEGFTNLEPNFSYRNLQPDDGPAKFGLAVTALRKIITAIEGRKKGIV